MSEIEIIDVFAVYVDYGNVGDADLIGVFSARPSANRAAERRGSLDGAGNGRVEERKGIKIGDEVYLLELNFPIKLNAVVRPDPREFEVFYGILVTSINNHLEFMKVVRKRTGMGLKEVKDLVDRFRDKGKARIEPFHDNISCKISREEFIEWKQELEMNNFATIEAI